jgi:hypothetical protein
MVACRSLRTETNEGNKYVRTTLPSDSFALLVKWIPPQINEVCVSRNDGSLHKNQFSDYLLKMTKKPVNDNMTKEDPAVVEMNMKLLNWKEKRQYETNHEAG